MFKKKNEIKNIKNYYPCFYDFVIKRNLKPEKKKKKKKHVTQDT